MRIRPEHLRQLAVPTLMIWGENDPIVSIADARAAAELIPYARLEACLPAMRPSSATPNASRSFCAPPAGL